MSFAQQYRHQISSKIWDEFVLSHPDSTYFGTTGWLDGILSVQEWGLIDYSFGVFADGKLVAVLPLQWNPRSRSLLSSGWGGCFPLIGIENRKIEKFIFQAIESIAECLGATTVQVGSLGHVSISGSSMVKRGLFPALRHGFTDMSSYAQVIDLRVDSQDILFKNLSETARQIVRKAEKQLRIELVSWKEHLDDYYNLHKITYRQSNILPYPFRYFEMIADCPIENHKLFAAFDENGKIVAYHNDLYFKKNVLYHTASSSPAGNKLGAHYLLTWQAIMNAYQTGCQHYEIGEIPLLTKETKSANIGFFKTRFGGDLYRMLRFQRAYTWNPKIDALKVCGRSMRSFLSIIIQK